MVLQLARAHKSPLCAVARPAGTEFLRFAWSQADADTRSLCEDMRQLKNSCRGAAKRFSRTAKGKFKRSQAFLNHILTKKSTKRKRQLRGTSQLNAADVQKVERMLRLR